MITSYTKAIMAALAAIVATANVVNPSTSSQWLQVIGYGVGSGLLTAFVPNTVKATVIKPQLTAADQAELEQLRKESTQNA